jgi:hypothetical protein
VLGEAIPSKGPRRPRRGPARVVSGCQGKAFKLVFGLPPCSHHRRHKCSRFKHSSNPQLQNTSW